MRAVSVGLVGDGPDDKPETGKKALTICNKSLRTDKAISCYLWKNNIYLEAVRLQVQASLRQLRGRYSAVSEAGLDAATRSESSSFITEFKSHGDLFSTFYERY
ncbi:uncharacterized protein V6R79_020176 [Siganus canaliculatus]